MEFDTCADHAAGPLQHLKDGDHAWTSIVSTHTWTTNMQGATLAFITLNRDNEAHIAVAQWLLTLQFTLQGLQQQG